MTRPPLVAIFAKAPMRGQVKTRLAADIGDDAALGIYRHLLKRTLSRLSRPDWQTEVWVTPDETGETAAHWPVDLPRRMQGGGDLGARMMRALALATEDRPVIVVGTDIPDLDAGHIEAALVALGRTRLAFGPSGDGGFYLIGARGPPPEDLFRNVPWSTAQTLERCLANAEPIAPELIEQLDDLDTLADLDTHRGEPDWDSLSSPSTFS